VKSETRLFLVAVQFLTRLPVAHLPGFQTSWLSASVRYFPVAGVLVGVLCSVVWWAASRLYPPAVAVGLMMAASLLLTGAFHEDGFADVCDGFGGGRTREAVLAIMKDSRVGAYGAIGVAMMLGLKWSVLVALPPATLPVILVGGHAMSRWCAIALIWRLEYVRTDPNSKSKLFADSLSGATWFLSGAMGAVVFSPTLLWIDAPVRPGLLQALLAAALASLIVTYAGGRYFRKKIGGYTGDCLGAIQQLTELTFLLAALGVNGMH
jgi:adenosylcobinamide-GDP ribazoletransferase